MAITLSPPAKAPATTVIDKRGDVLLQLTKDGQPTADLLFSSQVLSLASPVFEAMFNHGFAEGQDLSSASPRSVPLPDDDPTYMTILCNIFHMRTSDVPDTLDLDSLAGLAIICDKYDCLNGVRFHSRVWVAQLLPDPEVVGFEKLLFVAYVLDLPHEFYKVTQSLIQNRKVNIKLDVVSHGHDFVPWKIIGAYFNFLIVPIP